MQAQSATVDTLTREALTREEILVRAQELAAAFRRRGALGDEMRRVPEESVEEIRESGLLSMLSPRELGGHAADLQTFVDVARIFASGDAGHAWTFCFLIFHTLYSARLDDPLRGEMFGDKSYTLSAGANNARPPAAAVKTEGGYRISGRWPYASGCLHADWIGIGAQVEGERGRYQFTVPVEDVRIEDTWSPSGMRATGSNDVVLDDVFIPEHRALGEDAFYNSVAMKELDYALLKIPIPRIVPLMMTGFLVGAAEGALDLYPPYLERTYGPPGPSGAEQRRKSQLSHATYGEAVAYVDTAKLLLNQAVSVIAETYGNDGDLSMEERAHQQLLTATAGHLAGEAVTMLVRDAGSSARKGGSDIDRVQRDVEMMLSNPVNDWNFARETAGRVLLGYGLEPINPAFF